MEHKQVYIDNADVSKCPHFIKEDNIPVIGRLNNYCCQEHNSCEENNCEFKIMSKNDTLKKYKKTLEQIVDYCNQCKDCVETGDEVILYTIIKKIDEVIDDRN